MEYFSISNLAWSSKFELSDIAPKLVEIGFRGIEIAPTLIWQTAPEVNSKKVLKFKNRIEFFGLQVSGLQSLLHGKNDLNLFDKSTWPQLKKHLIKSFALANCLDSKVVVFGSPKNRIRGSLSISDANDMAALFFDSLIKYLEEFQVTLTLEPNAPQYGADYLLTYDDAITLSSLISSDFIKPQIDIGCLQMVGEDPKVALNRLLPKHLHISSPYMEKLPDGYDHASFATRLHNKNYNGWVVLEIKPGILTNLSQVLESANWLIETYKFKK